MVNDMLKLPNQRFRHSQEYSHSQAADHEYGNKDTVYVFFTFWQKTFKHDIEDMSIEVLLFIWELCSLMRFQNGSDTTTECHSITNQHEWNFFRTLLMCIFCCLYWDWTSLCQRKAAQPTGSGRMDDTRNYLPNFRKWSLIELKR